MRPRLTVCIALLAAACGSSEPSEVVRKTIGPEGGVIVSADSVLTIAVQPGAIEEPTEVTIQQSDEPPDVFGPAYRVAPDIELLLPATLTYRHELPSDPTGVAIGYVDADDFKAGTGRWRPLPVLTIDAEQKLVKGRDTRLNIFYALLDEGGGGVVDDGSGTASMGGTGDTGAESSGEMPTTGDATDPTGATDPTDPTDASSSGTDTGMPDPCADPFMGPYDIVEFGDPLPGAEDLGFDGDAHFVAVSGTDLVRVDTTGNATVLATDVPSILGLRYTGDGRVVAAANVDQAIVEILANGTVNTILPGMVTFPNGIFADRNGLVWLSDFSGGFIGRITDTGMNPTVVSNSPVGEPNGVHYDEDRQAVFYSTYGPGIVYRQAVDASFNTMGAPVQIAMIAGATLDGVTQDECGNLYVVDQNNGGTNARLFRLFLDAGGDVIDQETIVDAGDLATGVANAQFATGAGWAAAGLDTSIFLTGLPGTVYRIEMELHGAQHAAFP